MDRALNEIEGYQRQHKKTRREVFHTMERRVHGVWLREVIFPTSNIEAAWELFDDRMRSFNGAPEDARLVHSMVLTRPDPEQPQLKLEAPEIDDNKPIPEFLTDPKG